MSKLWLPPRISRELEEQTLEHDATVNKMVERLHGLMAYWTETLQRELDDPRLEVVYYPPLADPTTGLKPGRYHVLRHNPPPAPMTAEPIEVNGEFAEPGTWLIEHLRASDLQNPQAVRDAEVRKRKEERAKERANERDEEERKDHLKEAYDARFRTQVSMNRNTPWSQNVAGRRGARA